MSRLSKLFLFVVYFSFFVSAQSIQKYGELGNFKLENGSIIENCKIGFKTFGKLNPEKSNAVIYPTWFGGTSYDIMKLIGPAKLIDSANYFIIAIDALGNGVSSSPSNSITQANDKFPVFSVHDMVQSEYQLITKVLGINHLFAAVGGSMGSVQIFDWLVSYPDFIDKAVPYVCTPQLSAYDLLLWNLQLGIIETGHKYNVSEREIRKSLDLITALNGKTPEGFNKDHSYADFPKYLSDLDREPSKVFTNYNFASQIRAVLQYNITKNCDNSIEKAAKLIKAKVFMIFNERDMMVNPRSSGEFAKLINAKVLKLNNINGHLAVGSELARCREEIKKFLEEN